MKQSGWPTLGQMIDSGKRVVVFMDSGADNGGVDYILPEFQMVGVVLQWMMTLVINGPPAGLGNAVRRFGRIFPLQSGPKRGTAF